MRYEWRAWLEWKIHNLIHIAKVYRDVNKKLWKYRDVILICLFAIMITFVQILQKSLKNSCCLECNRKYYMIAMIYVFAGNWLVLLFALQEAYTGIYELKQDCCFLSGCRVRLTASNIISRLTPSRRLISRRDKLAIGCYVSLCALPVDSRVVLAFRISSASQEWINRRPPRRFLVFRRKNLYVCHRNKFNQKMFAVEAQKTGTCDI